MMTKMTMNRLVIKFRIRSPLLIVDSCL